MHGFDEFFGNLYHLNAEEEPESPNWPPADDFPQLQRALRPARRPALVGDRRGRRDRGRPLGARRPAADRGHRTADEEADGDDRRRGRSSTRSTSSTASTRPARRSSCGSTRPTCTSARTRSRRASARPGAGSRPYHDTMIDHDKLVGALLDKLDELGLAEDTIVIYSTDNGPHMNTWPDGGMTPFRSEKNTNWEGAFRVPQMIRWPGRIPAGSSPTRSSSTTTGCRRSSPPRATPTSSTKLKAGHTIGDDDLQGPHRRLRPAALPHRRGRQAPRKGLVYFSDDGDVLALRFDNWKIVFMEQRVQGTLQIWAEPFVALRVPKLFNLRTDPFERADITSNTYWDWLLDNAYIVLAATGAGRRVPRDVQGVPAAPEGGELHASTRWSRSCESVRSPPAADARTAPASAWIPAATFRMGSDAHYPEEAPARAGRGRRLLDRPPPGHQRASSPRSSAATGYVTVAERPLDPADFPGAPAENLVPGRSCSPARAGPVDLRHMSPVVGVDARAPAGAAPRARRPRSRGRDGAPGRARRLRGRRAYAAWAGQGAADRGRVGAGGARRPRRRGLHVGRRARAAGRDGSPTTGTATSPGGAEPGYGAHRAGRLVPRQRLRALRHGRQRLGVDARLVLGRPQRGAASETCAAPSGQPQFRHHSSRARWSRAARSCAPTATACATGPPPAGRR